MSNSTQWHKHKDGVWHRRKRYYKEPDFYKTRFGEPYREKSTGRPLEKAKPPKGAGVAFSTTH